MPLVLSTPAAVFALAALASRYALTEGEITAVLTATRASTTSITIGDVARAVTDTLSARAIYDLAPGMHPVRRAVTREVTREAVKEALCEAYEKREAKTVVRQIGVSHDEKAHLN